MMMVEDIKKAFNNSLKEIQENTAKELQVLKNKNKNKNRKTQPNRKKSLKKNRKTHPNR
jgi:vacuolar-type H+-ATPase subunit E/Vma4